MTQVSTNVTFKNGAFSTVTGVGGTAAQALTQELTVEYLAADPSDLATTSPRIWVNTTTGILKFTYTASGTPIKTVTAT